jgi:hypothetical protein
MPRFLLFATNADYKQLVLAQDFFANLYFVEDTVYPDDNYPVFQGVAEIPDVGIIKRKWENGPTYRVLRNKPTFRLRRLPDFEGEKRFDLDGHTLEQWIAFQPNGLFGEKTIICGHVEPTGTKGDTVPLFRAISRAIAQVFTKAQYCGEVTFVGSDALALQKQRYCLRLSGKPKGWGFKPAKKPPSEDKKPVVPKKRRKLDQTWRHLAARGEKMPRDGKGKPLGMKRMPGCTSDTGGFSFFRTTLEREDYSLCTLPRTFFGRSGFEEVNFRDTDLSESRMCWNDFTNCDFTKADLSGCDMRASVFDGCKFTGAILRGADLRMSSFAGCSFKRADLTRAAMDRGAAAKSHAKKHLSKAQIKTITWHDDPGDEPEGG